MPEKKRSRPSWDETYMKMAKDVAQRSTCIRHNVGAVLVKDNRVIATGYNGAPRGLDHCLDIGGLRDERNIASGERHEICRAIHAEQNAIIQAAYMGSTSTDGATLYSTHQPCILCTKVLINAGIKRVMYEQGYPDEDSREYLAQAGVALQKYRPKPKEEAAAESI